MFGYLTAAAELLTEEQQLRYRACYCGLCLCLRRRHGQVSRLTLNYDMCFLVLLLNSLYEPEEQEGEGTCLLHPLKPRGRWQSAATDYGADMDLALSYHKCADDWRDDGDLAALAAAGALKRAYLDISERCPRQCAAMAASMEKLRALEDAGIEDADAAASAFGELLGELFVWREDRWAGTLRAMGRELGSFIYIMDACMDLDKDSFHGRYNPFRRYYGLPDNEERFRDMLKLVLGPCLFHFDRLPLVQDADILKNILCFGLWAKFDKKYSDKKGPSDDPGSV